MNSNDMIIIDDDNITCDGYRVNSNFLNKGIPISCNINNNDLFGKSIPCGLSFLNTETISETVNNDKCDVINSSTYDKFIDNFTIDSHGNQINDNTDDNLSDEFFIKDLNEFKDEIEPEVEDIKEDTKEDIKENTELKDEIEKVEDTEVKDDKVFEKSKTRKDRNQTRGKKHKKNKTRIKRSITKKKY